MQHLSNLAFNTREIWHQHSQSTSSCLGSKLSVLLSLRQIFWRQTIKIVQALSNNDARDGWENRFQGLDHFSLKGDNACDAVGSLGVEHYGNGEIKKAKKLHLGISFYTKRGFLHHRRKDETILFQR